ncbi:unnamed protein product [Symbiodinium necroappetens]|uniref:Uncharacterized protein n=1 Tax=Symbiodinium necroappetens TaxID=1628268 RepID=A0A813AJU0_9DINO|nr:unnamed protein product [Symbiodinium necroappetens]
MATPARKRWSSAAQPGPSGRMIPFGRMDGLRRLLNSMPGLGRPQPQQQLPLLLLLAPFRTSPLLQQPSQQSQQLGQFPGPGHRNPEPWVSWRRCMTWCCASLGESPLRSSGLSMHPRRANLFPKLQKSCPSKSTNCSSHQPQTSKPRNTVECGLSVGI